MGAHAARPGLWSEDWHDIRSDWPLPRAASGAGDLSWRSDPDRAFAAPRGDWQELGSRASRESDTLGDQLKKLLSTPVVANRTELPPQARFQGPLFTIENGY